MSIPVPLDRLRAELVAFGRAPYLLTVSPGGRPHAVAVAAEVTDEGLRTTAGRTTAANAARSPLVSVVWPPDEAGGYSLIVDGEARVEADGALAIRATGAVLHRPGPPPGGQARPGCTADCVPLDARHG